MKKIILFLTISLLLISCSSDDSVNVGNTPASNALVINDSSEVVSVCKSINELNCQLEGSDSLSQTRGFGKWFKKIWRVFSADAVGALFGLKYGGVVGAAAGAVTMSTIAVVTDNNNNSTHTNHKTGNKELDDALVEGLGEYVPHESLNSGVNLLPNTKIKGNTDSIGYIHNKVVNDIFANNHFGEDSDSITNEEDIEVDTVLQWVSISTANLYNINEKDINKKLKENSAVYEDLKSIQEQTATIDNIDDYFNRWKQIHPEKSGELDILKEFFNGLLNDNIETSDGNYMDKVLDIISDSNLDEDMKQNLRNAVIVGNASHELWIEK